MPELDREENALHLATLERALLNTGFSEQQWSIIKQFVVGVVNQNNILIQEQQEQQLRDIRMQSGIF